MRAAERQRLDELLSRWEASGGSLDASDLDSLDPNLREAFEIEVKSLQAFARIRTPAKPQPPTIPGYEFREVVGEGAMGVVWEATHRLSRRRVAIKLLNPARLGSSRAIARFQREVELASRLEHPHIARVYESGVHGSTVFYAMQFIEGRPIALQGPRPDARDVVRRLLPLCDAIAYAHARGVIHRDLKPTNILVEPSGRVMVLDFGLAAEVDQDRSAVSLEAPVVGTPGWASPEQCRYEPADTRSDLWSIGVLLHVLLSGSHPYDLKGGDLAVMQRVSSTPASSIRRAMPSHDRDLALVVDKALAHDRTQRYATVAALQDDLTRWLERRPILARRPSAGYLASKWAMRHRKVLVPAGTAALVTLAAGSVLTYRLIAEQRRAASAGEQARAVNQFLESALSAAAPEARLGRDMTVVELLEQSLQSLNDQPMSDPLVDAAIRYTLSRTFSALGDGPRARELAEQAYTIRRDRLGEFHSDTLDVLSLWAGQLMGQELEAEAINAYRRVLQGRLRQHGPDHLASLGAQMRLASALQYFNRDGRHSVELAELTQGLLDRATRLNAPPDLLDNIHTTLSSQAWSSQDFSEAIRLLDLVLADRIARFGEDHPRTIQTRYNLGAVHLSAGLHDRAIRELEIVVPYRTRIYGRGHPNTYAAVLHLLRAYRNSGQLDRARSEAAEAWRSRPPVDLTDPTYQTFASLCAELGVQTTTPATE
jgi:tetratricopeptide (TPR) repeat protein